ncbi:MAG: glycosyl hydrolase 53 family protein [Bifidobacteriaceae bacterium]|jgi:arabinogalactan endo-1,4-beta-galactosidase|nr:glycosyl hydrolase 53 family protein [Bifidobacteriaceae bacterium]
MKRYRTPTHLAAAALAAACLLAAAWPAAAMTTATGGDGPVEAGLYVEAVEGLPEDFWMGVDISTILSLEASGVVFRDAAGEPADIFDLLAEAGVNYVRVRIWNDPHDAEGHGYGAGNCDVATAIAIGQRATEHGMKLLANFHYSDFWADPGKQTAPKAWQGLSQAGKEAALYEYTYNSVAAIIAAGVDLGLVQVGNETTSALAGSSGSNMYALIKQGAAAVRAAAPEVLVGVHFTNPERGNYAGYAANLASNNVDYDVFLSSYYPFWHGTLANLTAQLNHVATNYGKLVAVAETSWAHTFDDPDGSNSVVATTSGIDAYPVSPQGQATEVRDVIAAVNAVDGGKGMGVFYWEPAWLAVPGTAAERSAKWEEFGSGWATSYAFEYITDSAGPGGSGWDNQALFAADGTALESLNVFKYVYTGATTDQRLESLAAVEVHTLVGEAPALPATVAGAYNTGQTAALAVTWDAAAIAAAVAGGIGAYTITGSVAESDTLQAVCTLYIEGVNLLSNPGFENSSLSPWTLVHQAGSGAAAKSCGTDAKSGTRCLNAWREGEMRFTVEQTVTNLDPGVYMLAGNIHGDSGKGEEVFLYAKVDGQIVATESAAMADWGNWLTPAISGLELEGDTLTVGMSVAYPTGGWAALDDFILYRTADAAPRAPSIDLAVEASPRCIAGKVVLTVYAQNLSEATAAVVLSTPFGDKTLPAVAPGKYAAGAFTIRQAGIESGTAAAEATALVEGQAASGAAQVAYPAIQC